MIVVIETIESKCRPLNREWTLEPMVDIAVDPDLVKILEEEIKKVI